MSIELDHFFILTNVGAPEADLLVDIGLLEGNSNKHPGQGTSNRRFFCQNTTLEFLYVHDLEESLNGPAKRLQFAKRNHASGTSPFGMVMRTIKGDKGIAFNGWKYCPEYFASDTCFFVGENSENLQEPLCICMPENLPKRKPPPTVNADWKLTELKMSVPVPELSKPLLEVSKCENIVIEPGKANCLELTFNNNEAGQRYDFTAMLPLIINR